MKDPIDDIPLDFKVKFAVLYNIMGKYCSTIVKEICNDVPGTT